MNGTVNVNNHMTAVPWQLSLYFSDRNSSALFLLANWLTANGHAPTQSMTRIFSAKSSLKMKSLLKQQISRKM